VIGSSEGRRRPGYAVSIEPGVSYGFGSSAVSLAVPYAVYRNRTENVDDIREGEGPGDAAFADYLIMVAFSHSFAPPAVPIN